jgi:regulator of RNase E activity RraA
MSIGSRILPRVPCTDPTLIDRFRSVAVANASDMMGRLAAGGPRLRPIHKSGTVLCGPAFTVKTRPGDNLIVHKAISLAEAGDIIVVDAGGDLTNAIFGEIMLLQAIRKNLGGIVINGSVRDLTAIEAHDFPVFAVGVTHRGPYKNGPGEINVPIALDGMVIAPGDIILGDPDGLVSVPLADAETVLAASLAKSKAEAVMMQEIESGTYDDSWIDQLLGL